MFHVIQKDSDIVDSLAVFEHLDEALRHALELKKAGGLNFDVLQLRQVWTTQTLDEAHRLSLDVPHIGRD